ERGKLGEYRDGTERSHRESARRIHYPPVRAVHWAEHGGRRRSRNAGWLDTARREPCRDCDRIGHRMFWTSAVGSAQVPLGLDGLPRTPVSWLAGKHL